MRHIYLFGFNGFSQVSTLQEIVRLKLGESGSMVDEAAEEEHKHIQIETSENNSNIDSPEDALKSTTEKCNYTSYSQNSTGCIEPVKLQLIKQNDKLLASWSSLYYLNSLNELQFLTGNLAKENKSNKKINFPQNVDDIASNDTCSVPFETAHLNTSQVSVLGVGDDRIVVRKCNDIYMVHETNESISKVFTSNSETAGLTFSVGDLNTVAMKDGKLFDLLGSTSSTKDQQYGQTEVMPVHLSPVDLNFKVKQTMCGKEHVLLLSEGGLVLAYGLGSRGQLGNGSTDPITSPHVIEMLEPLNIVSIAAGGWHSMALSDSGDLYAWGWNESGQLGIALCPETRDHTDISDDKPDEEHSTPVCQVFPCLVEFPIDVTISEASCGSRHSAAVSDVGQLWTWGWNGYGQLGHTDLPNCHYPKRCDFFLNSSVKINSVYCNAWTTIAYSTDN